MNEKSQRLGDAHTHYYYWVQGRVLTCDKSREKERVETQIQLEIICVMFLQLLVCTLG